MTRSLYEDQITMHVLALWEALVRHDENEKAYKFLKECVPYFLVNDPLICKAVEDQTAMTEHLRDERVYAEYYGNNPHEASFEEMFGGDVEWAIKNNGMQRIPWLIEQLQCLEKCDFVLDVACNDGAIAKYISEKADCAVVGLDLNPDCVKRAIERGVDATCGTILDITEPYDAVYAMEVIEHVPDPVDFLRKLSNRAPEIFISTPFGATAMGDVPNWHVVEHKGHVRAVLPSDVHSWGEEAGLEVEFIGITGDGIIVAHYARAG